MGDISDSIRKESGSVKTQIPQLEEYHSALLRLFFICNIIAMLPYKT
jgi:hypothetical protein